MTPEEYLKSEVLEDDEGLHVGEHCIMHRNEEPFIRASVREICLRVFPQSVLEIGFGFGFTACEFQKCGVKRHVIIEPHPKLYERAKELFKDRKNVIVINDFWQNIKLDEDFDLLYYDPYELADLPTIHLQDFRHKWFAQVYSKHDGEGCFEFEADEKKKYQLLVRQGEVT